MISLKNKTVAEIVSEDISTASIFKKYNIDFCCGGGKTVEEACNAADINLSNVLNELNGDTKQFGVNNLNFRDWNIGFLIDYIINEHHNFIRNNIKIINDFAKKVARVHGVKNIETIEIAELFSTMSDELILHIKKEEEVLFPKMKYLVEQSVISKKTYSKSCSNEIKNFEHEHDEVGIIAKRITKLTNNFSAPENACNTYKALYFKLDEFISDLFKHIHLENNILFPKVKSLI